MNYNNFNLLPKKMLIEIILADDYTRRKAERRVIYLVHQKICEILDKQTEALRAGDFAEEERLEKEYQKWAKIQDSL